MRLTALFFSGLMFSSISQAGLLETLRDNGTLSQEEYASLKAEQDQEITISGTNQLAFKSPGFSYQIGGRLYTDFAYYDEDETPLASGGELRTARLSIKGKFYDNWRFRTQYAFNDDSTTTRYVWLGYQQEHSILRAGRLVESAGVEDYTSSRYITFMERALPALAFAGNFAQGVDYRWWNDNSHLYVAALLDNSKPADPSDPDETIDSVDEEIKWHARYSIAPINQANEVLHLGAWANYLEPASETSRTRTRPEAHVDDSRLIDTGTINNVSKQITGGVELAWLNGPISLQAEYMQREVSASGMDDVSFGGFYLFGSYFITGESRHYYHDYGAFDRVTPKVESGAVEVALRYSELDLNDGPVQGGAEQNWTAGINWLPRKNLRLSLNQTLAHVEDRPGLPDEDIGITQVRAQVDF